MVIILEHKSTKLKEEIGLTVKVGPDMGTYWKLDVSPVCIFDFSKDRSTYGGYVRKFSKDHPMYGYMRKFPQEKGRGFKPKFVPVNTYKQVKKNTKKYTNYV